MTLKEYWKESGHLLDAKHPHRIPSKAFIDIFQKRVDKAQNLMMVNDIQESRQYLGRDSEDYNAWGYALTNDIHYDAEGLVHDLQLMHWMDLYNLFDDLLKGTNTCHQWDTFKESAFSILEDEIHTEVKVNVSLKE